MNERDWDKFFDLLERIVDREASHAEKRQEVIEKAKSREATDILEEFGAWFPDGIE